jgi:hypothetical protein
MAQTVISGGGERVANVEFGYVLLERFVALFTGDPRLVVAAISLLAAILFFLMLYMWENGQSIVSLAFIPVCYYVFTMNTLRIGIAFPLAAISILQLEKKQFARFFALAIASISIQMTAVLLLPMLFLARSKSNNSIKGALYGLFLGASILYLGYYVFGGLLLYKLSMFSIITIPSSNSGVVPLIISFVCSIITIWFSEYRYRYIGIIFFLIQVASYIITQYSYDGLRLQTMALFAQFLALSYSAKRPIRGGQIAIVLLLCCLTFTEIARTFISTAGVPFAFIPYHFIWEGR